MQLRNTIIFIPKGEVEIVKVEIYVAEEVEGPGYWNIDENKVLLSPGMYSIFRSYSKQQEQRKFFDTLRKVSTVALH